MILKKLAEHPADALLDVGAVAECLGVGERAVRAMVARGELPKGMRLGGKTRWFAGKLREFLSERADKEAGESAREARSKSTLQAPRKRCLGAG